jgi:hypothetical protein
MMDVVGAGITVKYGDFRLDHVKRLDENAGNNSFGKSNAIGTSIPNDGDVSFTSAKYVFKGDGFSLTPMLAYNADDNSSSVEYELFGFGLAGSVDLGPVHLKGEYNYFDGDREQMWDGAAFVAAENDVKGSQLYLDASMAATDNIRIGLMGFYAEGQAGTNDEQATDMNYDGRVDWAFADYHPESYGYYSTEFVNEFDIFDPAGASAGVTAGQIYGDIKVNEDLSLKLAALIFETEEDKNADVEGYTLNAGFAYALAENTSLRGQVNVLNMEDNDTDDELDTIQAIGGIHVKF